MNMDHLYKKLRQVASFSMLLFFVYMFFSSAASNKQHQRQCRSHKPKRDYSSSRTGMIFLYFNILVIKDWRNNEICRYLDNVIPIIKLAVELYDLQWHPLHNLKLQHAWYSYDSMYSIVFFCSWNIDPLWDAFWVLIVGSSFKFKPLHSWYCDASIIDLVYLELTSALNVSKEQQCMQLYFAGKKILM